MSLMRMWGRMRAKDSPSRSRIVGGRTKSKSDTSMEACRFRSLGSRRPRYTTRGEALQSRAKPLWTSASWTSRRERAPSATLRPADGRGRHVPRRIAKDLDGRRFGDADQAHVVRDPRAEQFPHPLDRLAFRNAFPDDRAHLGLEALGLGDRVPPRLIRQPTAQLLGPVARVLDLAAHVVREPLDHLQ